MDIKLFNSLEECNAEKSWHHIKDTVAIQLMGEDVFPVPMLNDADFYDVGNMIVRGDRSVWDKLTGSLSPCLSVGHISKFVTEKDRDLLAQTLGGVQKDEEVQLNPEYEFHESDMRNGVKKTVTAHLNGCEKWTIDFTPCEGNLPVDIVNKGYVNINKVYLVSEVFVVSEIKILVEIAGQEDHYEMSGRFPVGFSLDKYKLGSDNTLGDPKPVKVSSWKSYWINSECAMQLEGNHNPDPPSEETDG